MPCSRSSSSATTSAIPTRGRAPASRSVEVAAEEPPLPPLLAFVKGPAWERADEETREAFAELVRELGDRVVEVELPTSAQRALDWHRTIMEAEMAANLDLEWEKGRDQLSEPLRGQLARGREVRALDYQKALARIPILNEGFAGFSSVTTRS